MALGDIVSGQSSIASDSYLTIQPSSGDGYMIQNIWGGDQFEIYSYDGTNEVLLDTIKATPYSVALYKYYATNSLYIRVKNKGASTEYLGYSGIQIMD